MKGDTLGNQAGHEGHVARETVQLGHDDRTFQTAAGGLVIYSTLKTADVAETGALSAHSEGIIDLLSQSEAAEIAILFKEAGPDATRISVRTKPGGVDATVLTGLFGGGGHARAAGASLPSGAEEARARVLPEAARLATAVRR